VFHTSDGYLGYARRMQWSRSALFSVRFGIMVLAGCSSAGAMDGSGGAGTSAQTGNHASVGTGSNASTTSAGTATTASGLTTTGAGTGGAGGGSSSDTLDSNRDRLLKTYFDYLEASVTVPQSNGLSGANVSSVCDVWSKLDPSSQSVFLTLTARLQRSILGVDGSSMLSHVTKIYRITGGESATQTNPGSCGGGEFNRMIMSMDPELHTVQVAANTHQGALQGNGKFDIADAPPHGTFWRDSHDLGGAHAPFDTSDETDQGAPRGQTQYFADPTSQIANAALGRQDLMTLVDPYALEMDEDYDCIHNSNPLCSYITYGPLCLPEASALGTALFLASYGDYEPTWKPTGCP
jgi:hypothetical protein